MVVAGPLPRLAQPHRAQGGADRALPRRDEGPGDQHQRVPPDPAGEQWRERGEQM